MCVCVRVGNEVCWIQELLSWWFGLVVWGVEA